MMRTRERGARIRLRFTTPLFINLFIIVGYGEFGFYGNKKNGFLFKNVANISPLRKRSGLNEKWERARDYLKKKSRWLVGAPAASDANPRARTPMEKKSRPVTEFVFLKRYKNNARRRLEWEAANHQKVDKRLSMRRCSGSSINSHFTFNKYSDEQLAGSTQ